MARVYVSIGSNVERERHVRAALESLEARFGQLLVSPVYETEPVGFQGEPFYNLVVGFSASDEPEMLVEQFRRIEAENGRVRGGARFAPRSLDIDLLLFDDRVEDRGRVRLPRDEIEKYAFVLRPLADIAPAQVHPVSGERFDRMWARMAATDAGRPGMLRQVAFER
ncbi:MAG: 2-amino-4-hydroxy-6-hydroxymethyldihydropteridine diphosphokinase [Gammaproteobacteria bacterium]